MGHHNAQSTAATRRSDQISAEPLLEYFVEFRYSGHSPVGTHYDTTVSVPPHVDRETVIDRAAEMVATHVPAVRPSDLEPAYTSTDAVSLGETQALAVPGHPSRMELPEQIRYKHEDRLCEGKIVDVIPDSGGSEIEAVVVALHTEGADSIEGAEHRISFSAITACLDSSTG